MFTYKAETLALTKHSVNKIDIAQREMESWAYHLGIVSNYKQQHLSGATDAIKPKKWNCARHIAYLTDKKDP